MYPGREIFFNAPLEYVAAEVRYPYAPRLRQQDIRDAILMELGDLFPILRPGQHLTLTGQVGGPVSQEVDQVSRAFNRASNAAITVTASALTIETTCYKEFADFRAIVLRCLTAIQQHATLAAIERIGLRYVNEVRVPDRITDLREWRGWIADPLANVIALGSDQQAVVAQGAVQYATGEHRNLTLRFATALEGTGVIGDDPLKRRHPTTSGPFFALDIDSYWQPPPQQSPDWDAQVIMAVIDELHEPIGMAFQSAITEQLRDVVLRRKHGV